MLGFNRSSSGFQKKKPPQLLNSLHGKRHIQPALFNLSIDQAIDTC